MAAIEAEAAALPVSVEEAKAFLRIAGSEEDAVIAGLVRSAAELCETFTGRMLVTRPVREMVAATGGWVRLGAGPVQAIEGAARVAQDGSRAALAAGDYAIDVDAGGDGWVRLPRGIGRVEVSYQAGLAGDANGVPETLRQGIVRLAAHLYAHRGGSAESGESGPPAAVTALWRPWRRVRL